MKRAVQVVLMLLGLALLGWLVARAGLEEVWNTVRQLGWAAPLLLVPYGIVYGIDTVGWRFGFGPVLPAPLTYARLFWLRWAAESVNSLLPSAYIGGEAVKVYLLQQRGVPLLTASASVVVSKSAQVLAQVVYIVAGALLALPCLPPGSGARPGLVLVSLAGVAGATALFWAQTHGLFGTLARILRRARIQRSRLERLQAKLDELDRDIVGFYRRHPRSLAASFGAFLLGWFCDAVEVWLACWLLGQPISWPMAVAIEAFIGVSKFLGVVVPGGLGIQDSGVVLLFRLFGLSETLGVTYALLRRARETFFVTVGTVLLYSLRSHMPTPTPLRPTEARATE